MNLLLKQPAIEPVELEKQVCAANDSRCIGYGALEGCAIMLLARSQVSLRFRVWCLGFRCGGWTAERMHFVLFRARPQLSPGCSDVVVWRFVKSRA